MTLNLTAPITMWDEALPLGNGLLGGLLWGEGRTLRLSLDRGDLWDERPAEGDPLSKFSYAQIEAMVAAKDFDGISAVVDGAYNGTHPTKIPAGRIELDLTSGHDVAAFALDLDTATGHADFGDGAGSLEVFFNAHQPVALLRLPVEALAGLRLLAPESVRKLGYPAAVHGELDGAQWFVQPAADGASSCVYIGRKQVGGSWLLATTVTMMASDSADVVAAAKQKVDAMLAAGYDEAHAPHTAWWRTFWSRSSVTVPDEAVRQHYQLVQYFYGAASRTGAPPIPLQGVWTADDGELPPWKGDYHHDLNTQMTYQAYQAAGRFEEGRVFLDFMDGLRPVFRKFAHDFYGQPGAAVPTVMTLAGAPMGGWAQYSLAPVNGAWVGHLFYLHWRYTRDEAYLRDVAYPWCDEVGTMLRGLLRRDEHGVWVLPLSSSPESFNNAPRAWLRPNSNYDLMCLRMLFLGQAEMADALGEREAASSWRETAEALGPYHVTAEQVLKLNAEEELPFSHRHFATLMGIFPFNLITVEGSDEDRAMIAATLPEIDRLGVIEWCGYSYTWMAALRARIGEPEAALWHLQAYLHAFILRNGFHANGDQTKRGFSSFDYRPFTLEGNFLACTAVQEMVLQSWSARPGTGEWGAIRIFPAMPWRWHEASFADLVVEGGHRVSARREVNATVWLRVVAAVDGDLRVRDNFGDREATWNRSPTRKDGEDFIFAVNVGEEVEATWPVPTELSPPPPNAYLDDVPSPPPHPGFPMTY